MADQYDDYNFHPSEVKIVENDDGTVSRSVVFDSEDLQKIDFSQREDEEELDESKLEEFKSSASALRASLGLKEDTDITLDEFKMLYSIVGALYGRGGKKTEDGEAKNGEEKKEENGEEKKEKEAVGEEMEKKRKRGELTVEDMVDNLTLDPLDDHSPSGMTDYAKDGIKYHDKILPIYMKAGDVLLNMARRLPDNIAPLKAGLVAGEVVANIYNYQQQSHAFVSKMSARAPYTDGLNPVGLVDSYDLGDPEKLPGTMLSMADKMKRNCQMLAATIVCFDMAAGNIYDIVNNPEKIMMIPMKRAGKRVLQNLHYLYKYLDDMEDEPLMCMMGLKPMSYVKDPNHSIPLDLAEFKTQMNKKENDEYTQNDKENAKIVYSLLGLYAHKLGKRIGDMKGLTHNEKKTLIRGRFDEKMEAFRRHAYTYLMAVNNNRRDDKLRDDVENLLGRDNIRKLMKWANDGGSYPGNYLYTDYPTPNAKADPEGILPRWRMNLLTDEEKKLCPLLFPDEQRDDSDIDATIDMSPDDVPDGKDVGSTDRLYERDLDMLHNIGGFLHDYNRYKNPEIKRLADMLCDV